MNRFAYGSRKLGNCYEMCFHMDSLGDFMHPISVLDHPCPPELAVRTFIIMLEGNSKTGT